MKRSNFKIILSTPNNRGIHRYAESLNELLANDHDSKLIIFQNYSKYPFKFIKFFRQIIWEFFFNTSNKENILFAYPRIPLYENFFRNKDRNYLIGMVVFDFIQCISKFNIFIILKLLKDLGFLEFIKRLVHTTLFNISLKNSDYYVVISEITKNNLICWISKRKLTLKKNIFVIHPLPSFNENKIQNYVSAKTYDKDELISNNFVIDFISISGKSPSKGSQILLPLFIQLANLNLDKTLRLKLFGVNILKDISSQIPNNLKIKCYPSIVKDFDLIDAYVNSSIFISTSFEEGFGIPFLDALLFGCNCLCSNLDVYKEIKNKYCEFNQKIYFIDRNKKNVIENFVIKAQEIINNNNYVDKKNKIETFRMNYRKVYHEHLSSIKKLPTHRKK